MAIALRSRLAAAPEAETVDYTTGTHVVAASTSPQFYDIDSVCRSLDCEFEGWSGVVDGGADPNDNPEIMATRIREHDALTTEPIARTSFVYDAPPEGGRARLARVLFVHENGRPWAAFIASSEGVGWRIETTTACATSRPPEPAEPPLRYQSP